MRLRAAAMKLLGILAAQRLMMSVRPRSLLATRLVRRLVFLLPLLSAGCASFGVPSSPPDARYLDATPGGAACARFFESLDTAVHRAGVADVQEARVAGFPHLRVNRFFAADWRPMPLAADFEAWARELMALDRHGRENEIANLSHSPAAEFVDGSSDPDALTARVRACGELLLGLDLSSDQRRRQLFESVRVADAYRGIYRVAGLYPLTSIAFYAGVKGLQEEIKGSFSVPLEAIPVEGQLLRYVPESPAALPPDEVAQILRRASDNPLGFPDPDPVERARLLNAFAPVLEIDVAQRADRIGRPIFRNSSVAQVDTKEPVLFTRISHARFESNTLLQLNYIFWFPARPKEGVVDILAGHLDGITWRVTLGPGGTPLMYDSMHNCGCYHLFIPAGELRLRELSDRFEEPVLVPQRAEMEAGRAVVRIASRSHYLQRVYFETASVPEGVAYGMEEYAELRSMPATDGRHRSLFGEDGLVHGSERPERWLFWPMGVPSAGAMRQWGHHATAFVGRRHFDDPALFERYFERVPGQ
jgi:hypothetical protein